MKHITMEQFLSNTTNFQPDDIMLTRGELARVLHIECVDRIRPGNMFRVFEPVPLPVGNYTRNIGNDDLTTATFPTIIYMILDFCIPLDIYVIRKVKQ